tara:strand:- start:5660 stop:7411 length:1752 start_codon:yes stop_codon:yes gene_type:complete
MKTLQLTNINFNKIVPDFYLSEDSLIFPECKSPKNKILVTSFLNDEKLISEFQKEVNDNYSLILPVLVNYLNHIHKEDYSNIYWERIVGFWLHSIITNYLDKYKRLVLAFEKEPNIKTTSLSFSSFQISLSTKEFLHAIRENDFFHLQQYSVILRDLKPNQLEYTDDVSYSLVQYVKKMDRAQSSRSIKKKIRELFLSILNKGYKSEVAFYVSLFSNKELFTFFWKSRFKYAPIFKDTTVTVKREIDVNLRNQISDFSTKNNFADSILHNSVKYFFPIELLEGYDKISEEATKHINKNIPTSIFTGIGFYWSSQFAVWSAKCAELGTKIYGIQHGGTYGDVEALDVELLERKISDKYITWGWSENENTIPMPASRLINIKKESFIKKNEILWVTTADSRFNYFVGQIVFGNRFLKYFEHQIHLYGSLSKEISKKIKIRLYKDDFGWKLKERFLDSYPNINFSDNSKNFVNEAAQSKLVIIDHLGGTTFLELLTLNIPVIIVANSNLFIHREEASSLYKSLKDVGVVFTSNEEAAMQIPEIINDIEKWMLNKERKKVIDNFKNKFALTDTYATKIWLDFFKNKL